LKNEQILQPNDAITLKKNQIKPKKNNPKKFLVSKKFIFSRQKFKKIAQWCFCIRFWFLQS